MAPVAPRKPENATPATSASPGTTARAADRSCSRSAGWEPLCVFLQDGRVELDSNRVENLIRPHALTRKNALFAGHDKGAEAWARIASLIGTCRVNGVEPYAYMKAVLEAIAAGHPMARSDDLLPWAFAKPAANAAA